MAANEDIPQELVEALLAAREPEALARQLGELAGCVAVAAEDHGLIGIAKGAAETVFLKRFPAIETTEPLDGESVGRQRHRARASGLIT